LKIRKGEGSGMGFIRIIKASDFDDYWKTFVSGVKNESESAAVDAVVNEVIAAVRSEGDDAVMRYSRRFEKDFEVLGGSGTFEVPIDAAGKAWDRLKSAEPELASSLCLAADNIRRFAELQKEQYRDFETEISPGLFTGQKVIPVEKAAIYVPAGRFPLISSALMGLIPAAAAGAKEKILVSPPSEGGLPDRRILAAACLAGADRVFAIGGSQAIAALALGTKTIPRVDLIAGPGNKYVAAAKRALFGEVGIDFVAGPTDVLVISGGNAVDPIAEADLIAADLLAQAEHDPDARARALVPDMAAAGQIERALERRLARLPTEKTARASLAAGGLIIVYGSKEEAEDIANRIAPEHLELQVSCPEEWIPFLRNYGSLFIGAPAAEALGDYSAGINHTLPTSGSARFNGGLSVRHFLKIVTTLRCVPGLGYAQALAAAKTIAAAEGLAAHAKSAALRLHVDTLTRPQ
jgi:histidinol dehydrogenase